MIIMSTIFCALNAVVSIVVSDFGGGEGERVTMKLERTMELEG